MIAVLALALGCQDVTPGERVLGDEVSAQLTEDAEGFGQSVAIGFGLLIAASPVKSGPNLNALSAVDLAEVRRVGVNEAGAWAWLSDGSVLYGDGFEKRFDLTNATALDRCPNGDFVWADQAGEMVACSSYGEVRTRCEDAVCSVHVNDGPSLDQVSPGGDLMWHDGQACWGDPMLAQEHAGGRVACEDGLEMMGMTGDHLGITLGAGRAAGRFNRHIVPPRLRIVPLMGGDVWLIDRAAENSRVSLASDESMTLVGVPRFRGATSRGRIYGVRDDE